MYSPEVHVPMELNTLGPGEFGDAVRAVGSRHGWDPGGDFGISGTMLLNRPPGTERARSSGEPDDLEFRTFRNAIQDRIDARHHRIFEEVFVAGLALQDWQIPNYDDGVFTQLERKICGDSFENRAAAVTLHGLLLLVRRSICHSL
jgi:hypothetical protein